MGFKWEGEWISLDHHDPCGSSSLKGSCNICSAWRLENSSFLICRTCRSNTLSVLSGVYSSKVLVGYFFLIDISIVFTFLIHIFEFWCQHLLKGMMLREFAFSNLPYMSIQHPLSIGKHIEIKDFSLFLIFVISFTGSWAKLFWNDNTLQSVL
jgi:hypothetical protein